MIKCTRELTHNNTPIFEMSDAGAVWYEVDVDEKENVFDTLEQAKAFIDNGEVKKMTYAQYTEAKQEALNKLPIFWAFSDSQFEEALKERGLTLNDLDKLYKFGNGGFYLKKDADVVRAYFNRKDELPELMKDHDFAVGAFLYELFNHEYEYNWQGDYDVLRKFVYCDYDESKDGENYLHEAGRDDLIPFWVEALNKYWDKVA